MNSRKFDSINKLLIIAALLAVIPFYFIKSLDIKIVKLFTSGDEFIYAKNALVIYIYKLIPELTKIYVLALISAGLFYGIIKRCPKKLSLILSTLIILSLGSGLIVNSLLKNNWGRARPTQIIEFGGDKNFTPVFVLSNQCITNCSFSSGHAAAGFNFITLSYFAPTPLNFIIYLSSILLGFTVGLVRVMQGGHFPSDVLSSAFIVILTNYLVHKYLYAKIEMIVSKILTK